MITIIDYGIGNFGSIFNMLKKVGARARISSNIDEVSNAEKIILPGVGHFDWGMEQIERSGLRRVLDQKAMVEKVPILGICLGMQLLSKGSEEGQLQGLGWIPAKTVRFKFPKESKLKIPHMGWNSVEVSQPSPLTANFGLQHRFYFVHSYHAVVEDEKYCILKTEYGYPFDSAIQNGNIFGVQFHPEKSHRFGMTLLNNFARL